MKRRELRVPWPATRPHLRRAVLLHRRGRRSIAGLKRHRRIKNLIFLSKSEDEPATKKVGGEQRYLWVTDRVSRSRRVWHSGTRSCTPPKKENCGADTLGSGRAALENRGRRGGHHRVGRQPLGPVRSGLAVCLTGTAALVGLCFWSRSSMELGCGFVSMTTKRIQMGD